MKLATGILKFAYDLLVGDSWPLTLSVVIVLLAGIEITMTSQLASSTIAVCITLAVAIVASVVVIGEARLMRRPPRRGMKTSPQTDC